MDSVKLLKNQKTIMKRPDNIYRYLLILRSIALCRYLVCVVCQCLLRALSSQSALIQLNRLREGE